MSASVARVTWTPDTDTVVTRVTNGVFTSNCYILRLSAAGDCIVIDPGLDAAPILAALELAALRPLAVLCTHGHFDHAGTAAALQRSFSCPVHLHALDLKTLKSSNFLLMAFKVPARIELPSVTPVEGARTVLTFGAHQVVFHHAPGHTPGSCVVQYSEHLFTGDTLYSRGVGLSKLPGEDPDVLRATLRALWSRFPDDNIVHPGHGDAAQFGWIKLSNAPLLRFLNAAAD